MSLIKDLFELKFNLFPIPISLIFSALYSISLFSYDKSTMIGILYFMESVIIPIPGLAIIADKSENDLSE